MMAPERKKNSKPRNRVISIPEDEYKIVFVRSSGPGGQNVNKVSTKAQLRFNIPASAALTEEEKTRLYLAIPTSITKDGDIVLNADSTRSQSKNAAEVVQKLNDLLSKALKEDPERKPTKIPKRVKAERVDTKKKRGEIKRNRNLRGED